MREWALKKVEFYHSTIIKVVPLAEISGEISGMPKSIVKRANVILKQLENENAQVGKAGKPTAEIAQSREGMQLSFFQLDDPVLCQVRDEILGLDVNNLTPLEALNKLNDIKRIVSGK